MIVRNNSWLENECVPLSYFDEDSLSLWILCKVYLIFPQSIFFFREFLIFENLHFQDNPRVDMKKGK